MLFSYLTKKFYKNFFLFFILLAFILSLSNLFVRMPLISSLLMIPQIFLLMLPLISQFAIPIASCLSIQVALGNLYIQDEVLFFNFFNSARRVLYKSVLLFSLSLTIIYIPLILFWAPQSYKKGKEFIVKFAKEQFYQLEKDKFHILAPGFTLFFKNKKNIEGRLIFERLLLVFTEKNGQKYLINAKEGYLQKHTLFLQDGKIQNLDSDKFYLADFGQTEIDLKKLFDNDKKEDLNSKQLKFLTWKKLQEIKNQEQEAYFEYHKRMAQVGWQFMFPFLSLWAIMIFGRRKSNLLASVFLSGILFLFSYVSLNLSQVFSAGGKITALFLYLPLIFLSAVSYCFYRKK